MLVVVVVDCEFGTLARMRGEKEHQQRCFTCGPQKPLWVFGDAKTGDAHTRGQCQKNSQYVPTATYGYGLLGGEEKTSYNG